MTAALLIGGFCIVIALAGAVAHRLDVDDDTAWRVLGGHSRTHGQGCVSGDRHSSAIPKKSDATSVRVSAATIGTGGHVHAERNASSADRSFGRSVGRA